ncbi:MAG: aminotransferase class I/II-fold pyridoxal phosphate-dependent enzyme [Deltaproteobacteria bacterium]|nr:aminotransferase class I/II-fold pyridoxal phosphate-dependent enzyme [Deltaproteobacteria bacterium]
MDIFQKCFDFQDAKFVKASGLYPFFRPIENSSGSTVFYDGKPVVMIGSNNYLGLTHDPRVQKKAQEAIDRFGTGCTGSRFLNGNTVLHDLLEEKLIKLVGKEAGLVFTTGFLTNLGTVACLVGPDDFILSDAENHASIIEGCRLSKATVVTYRHNDMLDLRAKLKTIPADKGRLIVTDGVFSMTGEIVDLPGLVEVKKDFPDVRLFLDDAHGLGVLGPKGEGTANYFGLTDEVDLIMGTFSKSFASIGGFLAGNPDVIDYVRHKARSFMFSAAMPPSAVATVLACLEILEKEPQRLEGLKKNIQYILKGFEEIGLAFIPSQTPIISVFVGDEGKAFKLVQDLFQSGVFATPVVFPAVPFGQAIIRTSYMATHTKEELDLVLETFAKLGPRYGILKDQIEIPKELTHQGETYSFAALNT